MEHVGLSPTRQTLIASSAKRREGLDESHMNGELHPAINRLCVWEGLLGNREKQGEDGKKGGKRNSTTRCFVWTCLPGICASLGENRKSHHYFKAILDRAMF